MVTKSELDALDLKEKTPAFWKHFTLTNLRLVASYLEAMKHVERLEDLERLDGDDHNSHRFLVNGHYRAIFEVEGVGKDWKSETSLEAAIKRINHLVRQVEAAPTYNEFFPRMAAVRLNDDDHDLPTKIFDQAIRFAFRKLNTASLPDNLGDKLLKGMADTCEERAQRFWRFLAKHREPAKTQRSEPGAEAEEQK